MIAATESPVVLKSVTVLKLKIESDHNETLDAWGKLCRHARNAGVMDWLLRQHGKPESERQTKRLVKRKDAAADKPKSESTKIYHAIAEAVPSLGSQVMSVISQSINSQLSTKVDWRRGVLESGKRPRRRDEILAWNDRPPFYTTLEIPLHNKQTAVLFGETLSLSVHGIVKGESPQRIGVRLSQLKTGHKKLLHELSSGKRKLPVSKLVRKDDAWYWHVALMFETERSADIEATLTPVMPEKDRPVERFFALALPDMSRPWMVGEGRYLIKSTMRLGALCKQIGWRYRQRMGAGHGRKKIDDAVSKRRTQERDMRTEVRRRAIADIVQQCAKRGVGVLRYSEPSLPLRSQCWFEKHGLEFDWTRFNSDLRNACARQGIEVVVTMLKLKDVL